MRRTGLTTRLFGNIWFNKLSNHKGEAEASLIEEKAEIKEEKSELSKLADAVTTAFASSKQAIELIRLISRLM